VFAELKKHRVILVTGPHRSGTTICAKMIAHDTGHDFVIEDEIGFGDLRKLSSFVHSNYSPVVIQCPFLTHIIDELNYAIDLDYSDTLVVMMHRYLPDIILSETKSKVDFNAVGENTRRAYRDESDAHPSDIKYKLWEYQCAVIPNAIDVGYESLKEHPLWIEDRSDMTFQHEIIQAPLPKVFRDGIRAIQYNAA